MLTALIDMLCPPYGDEQYVFRVTSSEASHAPSGAGARAYEGRTARLPNPRLRMVVPRVRGRD